eukprot:CAMPEP_0114122008 /NCGR_PEP_ID=MMETSP0043_2-20121206/7471_1 /TAXON_ID=464988 /ORGANISM="Hemiselmis andersenii, Strain CCMP644" /LENGTH=85 /DNA_ID=CAMNT_0001214705 /DNA_START=6 /DNA_END=260 /DNA_ORIENTATION=+
MPSIAYSAARPATASHRFASHPGPFEWILHPVSLNLGTRECAKEGTRIVSSPPPIAQLAAGPAAAPTRAPHAYPPASASAVLAYP